MRAFFPLAGRPLVKEGDRGMEGKLKEEGNVSLSCKLREAIGGF
jgi:hypothetical protein